MTDLIPAARPVPSTEDRMRDARTDTPPTTDPAPTHPGRSFRTWMSDTDRDQLDARAASAEQERDDALQDRDEARQAAKDLYGTLKTIERERDQALATARRYAKTGAKALTARNAAENDLRSQTQALREALDERDGLRQQLDHTRTELGAAQELIAVIDDATERIDRARATYATRGQQEATTDGLGSPAARAQEPQPGQFCAKHFSWLCQAGQGRCQAEARP